MTAEIEQNPAINNNVPELEEDEETTEESRPNLMSPEAVMMLSLAFIFDLGEVIIELFSKPLLAIPYIGPVLEVVCQIGHIGWNLAALIFFGLWLLFRSGSAKATQQTFAAKTQNLKAVQWAQRLKWLRPLFITTEFIPLLDNLPAWTALVYFELKYG